MIKAKYMMASNGVIELVRKVISEFPEKFIHINMDDFHFIFKDVPTSKWNAYVRLLGGSAQTLTKKKIEFCVWKQHWESSNVFQRARTIYHELTHVIYDKEKEKYKMLKHDVNEFQKGLELFGLKDENIEKVFQNFRETQAV